MIKGLYEAHLPVSNLVNSIKFYKKLDLEMAYQNDKVAFFWLEKGKSWLGLWETNQVEIPYHPSIRHVALQIDIDDMTSAKDWLNRKGMAMVKWFLVYGIWGKIYKIIVDLNRNKKGVNI
ncbi:VOC family protein [Peribacillus muralis]|uniref:VOC family protein n=1 Tax=Peribacillus muralis TaxID=264697 RepID=UPI003670BC7C